MVDRAAGAVRCERRARASVTCGAGLSLSGAPIQRTSSPPL
jgi:hypothetical protein